MSKRILLVEDEALIAMSEAQMLKKHGYEVATVYSGEKAMEAVEADPGISLILMDIDLGDGMDGTEAAEGILNKKDIPIVFLSSHTEPEVVEKTEGITSYGYIIKNSGQTVILASIRMAFRLYEAHMELKRQKENLNTTLRKYEETAEALEHSEDKYRNLVENSPIGIFQTNSRGEVLHVNSTAAHMVGAKTPEDMIARFQNLSSQLYVRSERRQRFTDELRKHGYVDNFEYEAKRLDGQHRWINESARISNRYDDGSFIIDGFAIDVTPRKDVEKSLENERVFLNTVLDTVKQAIIMCNEKGEIIRFNESARRLHGLPETPIASEQWAEYYDLYYPDGNTTLSPEDIPLYRALNGEDVVNIEIMVAPTDSDPHILSCNGGQLIDTDGQQNGAVIAMHDITEQKNLESRLRKQKEEYELVFKHSLDGILFTSPNGEIYSANPAACRMLAISQEALRTYGREAVVDMTDPRLPKALEERKRTGKFQGELRLKKWGTGEVFPVELNTQRFENTEGEERSSIFFQDISERKQKETELKEALKEKDFLMKELNHRVKNNLNMVSSLMSLKDSETEADLSDIKSQVQAIGLIHEKLYKTESVTEIRCRDYLADLLSSIFSSFTTRQVRIEKDIDDVCIPTKSAMSLGLIVNEIATNAIKHGFSEDEEPVFSIKMKTDTQTNRYKLTLSNSGNPFPEDVDVASTGTLGLQLIHSLVAQIDGTIDLQKKPSPVFTIRFPS